jgi:hypothetical protein
MVKHVSHLFLPVQDTHCLHFAQIFTFIIEGFAYNSLIPTWTLDTTQNNLSINPGSYIEQKSVSQSYIPFHSSNVDTSYWYDLRSYAWIDRGQGFPCQAAQDLSYYVALNILHYTYVSTYTIRTFMLVFLQIID